MHEHVCEMCAVAGAGVSSLERLASNKNIIKIKDAESETQARASTSSACHTYVAAFDVRDMPYKQMRRSLLDVCSFAPRWHRVDPRAPSE